MNAELAESYRCCRRIARRSSSNFYFTFFLLPRAKRAAMCALYAFLRRTDDLGDSGETAASRRSALSRWRDSLHKALAGHFEHPLLPALVDTVRRYEIPPDYLEAVIDGVEMDLSQTRYETFDELLVYCDRVAVVVGLACIHIWGFRGPEAYEPARCCGYAFQLTNILRDVREDACRDRVYLPQEDLRRFQYVDQDLKTSVNDGRFHALMGFEIARAEDYYRRAGELTEWLQPEGQRIFQVMLAMYHALLEEMRRREGDVLTRRVRLSGWRKTLLVAQSMFGRPAIHPAAASVEALAK